MKKERIIHLLKEAKVEYSDEYLVLITPKFLCKRFAAFSSIREDIRLMKDYLTELNKSKNPIITSSLSYALIAIYGKCFTDATKAKLPKLEEKEIFEEGSVHKATHMEIMSLRHNFIAHRGESDFETSATLVLIPRQENAKSQIRYKQLKQLSLGEELIIRVDSLLKYILLKVDKKIQKSGQKAYDGIFNTFSINELKYLLLDGYE